jgi:hypothetical protein
VYYLSFHLNKLKVVIVYFKDLFNVYIYFSLHIIQRNIIDFLHTKFD